MAPPVDINYLAVLVSAVVSIVLGMIWYSPSVFGKAWMQASGMTGKAMAAAKKGMAKSYVGMIVVALVLSYVLAHFVDYAQAASFMDGAVLGFWVWLGFVATVQIGSILWEQKPVKLFLINTGFNLVELLIMGGILAIWA